MKLKRKYPIGAELIHNGCHFRVWAPDHKKVRLVIETQPKEPAVFQMHAEKNGYFSLFIPKVQEGDLYRYSLGESEEKYADPASRFQPSGPNHPSMVIDPHYHWSDKKWKGVKLKGQIIYEMHIGTFTQEGTFQSAIAQLESLSDLGITLIEIMPLNEFPGRFGWGYEGVNLFAPSHLYGSPNDVKNFINKAHSLGIGVILDVVYNHFGPEHNAMLFFAKDYLNPEIITDWGQSINFNCQATRDFFLTNVSYWIQEYHFDGLRVDATSWLISETKEHILAAINKEARKAAGKKSIVMVGENEPQDVQLLRPYAEEGYGFDTLWNDDFHHTATVCLTGKREAYCVDYLGTPQEFISCAKYGFLYQGQYYAWQKKYRGTPSLTSNPAQMVIYIENHDQLGNTYSGHHLWNYVDHGNLRAMTTFMLLSPNTPMLFQGQEFGAKSPFCYFSDHSEGLNKLIAKGRKKFLSQFPRYGTQEIKNNLCNPSEMSTFEKCKLNFKEREEKKQLYKLHKDLITLRKNDPVFQEMQDNKYDGAVLGEKSFLLRYFNNDAGDRLLLVNFGNDHHFDPAPEPLLVAGEGKEWKILFSSESIDYGGDGTPSFNIPHWKIMGHAAFVLEAKPVEIKNI